MQNIRAHVKVETSASLLVAPHRGYDSSAAVGRRALLARRMLQTGAEQPNPRLGFEVPFLGPHGQARFVVVCVVTRHVLPDAPLLSIWLPDLLLQHVTAKEVASTVQPEDASHPLNSGLHPAANVLPASSRTRVPVLLGVRARLGRTL